MDDMLYILGFAVMALLLGVWIGVTGADNSWKNDCVQVGQHMSEQTIYLCEVVAK